MALQVEAAHGIHYHQAGSRSFLGGKENVTPRLLTSARLPGKEPRRGARGYRKEPQEAWPPGTPLRADGQT